MKSRKKNHSHIIFQKVTSKMMSIRELEFQFWQPFSHIDEDMEDGKFTFNLFLLQIFNTNLFSFTEEQSDRPLSHSIKQMRLSYKNMHLYGTRLEPERFLVVTCSYCQMILKPQALYRHVLQRHRPRSLLDEISSSNFDEVPSAFQEASIAPFVHTVKKRKIEKPQAIEREPEPVTRTKSMIVNSTVQNHYNLHGSQSDEAFKKPKPLKIKLKKVDQDSWKVISI